MVPNHAKHHNWKFKVPELEILPSLKSQSKCRWSKGYYTYVESDLYFLISSWLYLDLFCFIFAKKLSIIRKNCIKSFLGLLIRYWKLGGAVCPQRPVAARVEILLHTIACSHHTRKKICLLIKNTVVAKITWDFFC